MHLIANNSRIGLRDPVEYPVALLFIQMQLRLTFVHLVALDIVVGGLLAAELLGVETCGGL